MENRINNRDFEQFVKQNADQYRMFPSENVWDGIHERLHKRRRWFGAGIALLLLTAGSVTWVMLSTPSGQENRIATTNFESYKNSEKKIEARRNAMAPVNNYLAPKSIQPLTLQERRNNLFLTISTVEPTSDVLMLPEDADFSTTEQFAVKKVPKEFSVSSVSNSYVLANLTPAINKKMALAVKQPEAAITQHSPDVNSQLNPNRILQEEPSLLIPESPKDAEPELLSIESVTNSYVKLRKPKKISWQVYLTPLITYRALKENKTFIEAARTATNISGSQVLYYPADLDKVVYHKPDLGFNLGLSAGYPISKNLKIVSGLQFNVNKYDIKAYQYTNEVAPVALSNDAGGTNTVYPITSYRIVGGFKAKWLRNFYFSASVPIGGELTLINKKRTSFGISGTVQPSLVLENRSYLVSTDYKNYVELPSLTRRWNINTGLEVFAGVKTGKTEWRIGPQVRYQTLSSYKESYPVKEHLFDFGLKLGVMLR